VDIRRGKERNTWEWKEEDKEMRNMGEITVLT
jgi:hypothetical protein